jgi:hypothetical protein
LEKPISKSSVFIDGAARFKDLIYIIAKDRGLVSQEVEHSRLIAFDQFKFAHMGDRNWSAIAVCVSEKPTKKMVAVGECGDVATYTGGKLSDETIEPRPSLLRYVGLVDGYPLACGMQRQVYKRIGEGSWIAMNAPAPEPGKNAGFEAIDGFTNDEIYAVGWNGEIWQWNGTNWVNQESPVSLVLNSVCCAGDNLVYVSGQNGTLLRGRNAVWERVNLIGPKDDLWDVCWFNGTLFIASMTNVYCLKGEELEAVDFGNDRPRTCYRLTETEGVLWSVGSADVFSFDGAKWTRID